MTDLVALTTPRPVSPGHFSFDVPDGWQQGRGAFGGLYLAALVRAIESTEDIGARPLRSLTAELCAPLLPGRVDLFVEPLRRGGGMTTVAARIVQEGNVTTHAVGILARSRDDAVYTDLPQPAARSYRDLPPIEGPLPTFAQFFEYKNAGHALFSSGPALVESWVRMRFPPPRLDAAFVTMLADATWPALFPYLSEWRPMGTISFMLQLFGPFDGLDPAAPVYHRGRVFAYRDGYSNEMREVWTEDGRLLCLNQQIFATIR